MSFQGGGQQGQGQGLHVPAVDPNNVYTDRSGSGGGNIVRRPSPSTGSVNSGGSASMTTASNTSGPSVASGGTATATAAGTGTATAGTDGGAANNSKVPSNAPAERRSSLGSWGKFLGMNGNNA